MNMNAPQVDSSASSSADHLAHGVLPPEADAPSSAGQPTFVDEYQAANAKKRTKMLSRLSTGELAPYGPNVVAEHQEEMQEWMSEFMCQVIDVRYVSKGMRTGGVRRYSAVVVAGNRQGVLGMGTGKAGELAAAVDKANMRALKNLFTVPRYSEATTFQARTAKYGKAKVITYPRSSGSGILAAPMLSAICHLAGIRDIGVKVHGTRNAINIVKAFIIALESQTTPDELLLQQQHQHQHQQLAQQPADPDAKTSSQGHTRLLDALLRS